MPGKDVFENSTVSNNPDPINIVQVFDPLSTDAPSCVALAGFFTDLIVKILPIGVDNVIAANVAGSDLDITIAIDGDVSAAAVIALTISDGSTTLTRTLSPVEQPGGEYEGTITIDKDYVIQLGTQFTVNATVTEGALTANAASVIVNKEAPLLTIFPIATDDVISLTEAEQTLDIRGKASNGAVVTLSGDISATTTANSDGDWIITIPVSVIQALASDTDLTLLGNSLTATQVVRIFRKDSVDYVVTDIAHTAINPGNPQGQTVGVTQTAGSNSVVNLYGYSNGNLVYSAQKNNNSGTLTNFVLLSADVRKLVAPAYFESTVTKNGNTSVIYSEQIVYDTVNIDEDGFEDDIDGDPLSSEVIIASYPGLGENFHRKNTGPSTCVYDEGGQLKQIAIWFHSDQRWKIGVRNFPDGSSFSMVDIHDICNITTRDDNHNFAGIAVDENGNIVFVMDVHAHDVQGGYSQTPYDLNSIAPLNTNDFPGSTVDRVTYPNFYVINGEIIWYMRELDSGGDTPNFISYFYKWDGVTKTASIHDRLNAGVKTRQYVSNLAQSIDGTRVAILFMWRRDDLEPNGTNQQRDVGYIYSDDGMVTWRSANGTVQPMPLTYNNGLGTEGVTAYDALASTLIINTSPDGIPNKPGALCLSADKQPHALLDIKSDGKFYATFTGGNWIKTSLGVDESTSQIIAFGNNVFAIIHRAGGVFQHEIDRVNNKVKTNSIKLAGEVDGAFVLRLDWEAWKRHYLCYDYFRNRSNSTGSSGSYKTPMFHASIPSTQVNTEILDDRNSGIIFLDSLGIFNVTSVQEPIYLSGNSELPNQLIRFDGPFSVNSVTSDSNGAFRSENIAFGIASIEETARAYEFTAILPNGNSDTEEFEYHNYIPYNYTSRPLDTDFDVLTDTYATVEFPTTIEIFLVRGDEIIYTHPAEIITTSDTVNGQTNTISIPQIEVSNEEINDDWLIRITNFWGNYSEDTVRVVGPISGVVYPPTVTTYTPTNPDASWSPAALYVPKAAPIAGFEIIRMSNTGYKIQYSKRQNINADCTVIGITNGAFTEFRSIEDANMGELYLRTSQINSEWNFSSKDPNKIFGIGFDNRLRQLDLDLATKTVTINDLHVFNSGSNIGNYRKIYIGQAEGVQDKNDNFIPIVGELANGNKEIFIWSLDADDIVGSPIPVSSSFNYLQVSQSGNWALMQTGSELHKAPVQNLNQLADTGWGGHHNDCGYDKAGNEVTVLMRNGRIEVANLADGSIYTVYITEANDRFVNGHVSCRHLDTPGWAFLTTYDHRRLINVSLEANSDYGDPIEIADWGVHGAANYTEAAASGGYLEIGSATIAKNGLCAAFNSDWLDTTGSDDAYLIRPA